jgi:hypothetical protein
MSRKEQRERETLRRKKEQARRQREEELRRKRIRLERMNSMDRHDKERSASSANSSGGGGSGAMEGGKTAPGGGGIRPGNPFDMYPPSPAGSPMDTEEGGAGAGHGGCSEAAGNPFDDAWLKTEAERVVGEGRASHREYSNNHYAGRSDGDGVWEVSQTLSVSQLKTILVHIGLAKEATRAVDKRDLLESLSNGCHVPTLVKLSTKELKRRLKCLGKDAGGLLDKTQVAKRLRSNVTEYLYTQCF